ncbi:MAG: hypothetical protein INR68_18880, partial [Methylobacterium mesophilicum]|nr:hypothetical protein [Methylobacterium mesophilicum]
MAVPKPRLTELSDSQRDEMLKHSYDLWKAVCGSLAVIGTSGAHYEALADFAPELCSFAFAISDGATNFGDQLAAAHARAQGWESAPDRYDRDVEAAIAMCGGDERSAIKSLLVL